jgi:CspA family cold shock protein
LENRQRITGRVKWFDGVKGFGFVTSDSGGPDVLLHANVLRNFGQGSIAEASFVDAEILQTPKGMQVAEIYSISPPSSPEPSPVDATEALPEITGEMGPVQPARIKWFDKVRGFGFANVFGHSGDIFVHIEILRRCGLSELQPGEAVCIRVADGPRGKMAATVHSWDHGLADQ